MISNLGDRSAGAGHRTTPGTAKCPLAFSCCSKTISGTERSILFLIMDCGVFCTLLVNAHIANKVYVAIHMTMDGIKRGVESVAQAK